MQIHVYWITVSKVFPTANHGFKKFEILGFTFILLILKWRAMHF